MAKEKHVQQNYFGAWSGNATSSQALVTPSAPAKSVALVDKPGAPQTALLLSSLGASRSTPDYVPLEVMNTALGGLFSSRINMNLREEHGYTYGAGSGFDFRHGAGPFQIATGVRTDVTAPAVTEILKEVRNMASAPMTAEQLERAKDSRTQTLPA